jgi:hypothetical protein
MRCLVLLALADLTSGCNSEYWITENVLHDVEAVPEEQRAKLAIPAQRDDEKRVFVLLQEPPRPSGRPSSTRVGTGNRLSMFFGFVALLPGIALVGLGGALAYQGPIDAAACRSRNPSNPYACDNFTTVIGDTFLGVGSALVVVGGVCIGTAIGFAPKEVPPGRTDLRYLPDR